MRYFCHCGKPATSTLNGQHWCDEHRPKNEDLKLLLQRLEGKAKTVKVRIAVAVDESGDWSACGWRDATPREAMSSATDFADGETRCYWLTAELELPEPVEVKANVEEAE